MDMSSLCMGCMADKGSAEVCPKCGWQEGTQPEFPSHLPPRTLLNNRYLLGRVLGQGGFGITYLAWDTTLNTRLAIKEYLPQTMATRYAGETKVVAFTSQGNEQQFSYGLERFLEEARALARFADNPHIVAVRDYFEANGTGYLVMAYLDGNTFKHYLSQHGNRVSYENALKIMIPVMEALEDVHKVGLLHRDISPDNIYITQTNQIKILDFGAARYALGDRSKSLSIILKAGYAPEEQYRSKGVQGPWTDVYATAATFYRAITGQIPPESLDRIVEDSIKLPSQLGVVIPQAAEEALMKALSVFAQYRFQSMKEFKDALLNASQASASPSVQSVHPGTYPAGAPGVNIGKTSVPTAPPGYHPQMAATPYMPEATSPAPQYRTGIPGTMYQAPGQVPPAYPGSPPYRQPVPRKKSGAKFAAIFVLLLLVLLGAGGAYYAYSAMAERDRDIKADAPRHDLLDNKVASQENHFKKISVVKAITMCKGVDSNTSKPVDATDSFPSKVGTIYAHITLEKPFTGKASGYWYTIDSGGNYTEVSNYTFDLTGNDTFWFWVKDDVFTPGQWEFEMILSDGTYSYVDFQVVQ